MTSRQHRLEKFIIGGSGSLTRKLQMVHSTIITEFGNFGGSRIGKDVKEAIAFSDFRVGRDHHEPAGIC